MASCGSLLWGDGVLANVVRWLNLTIGVATARIVLSRYGDLFVTPHVLSSSLLLPCPLFSTLQLFGRGPWDGSLPEKLSLLVA